MKPFSNIVTQGEKEIGEKGKERERKADTKKEREEIGSAQ